MDFFDWLLIGSVVFILLLVIFRRFWESLIFDYGIDFLFSTLDTFIGGFVGFDIGDWIAGLIIFERRRQSMGVPIALFLAWEATNFFPVSLIPVVGGTVEIITNLVPSVFIASLIFNKTKEAKKRQDDLSSNLTLAEKMGIDTSKFHKKLDDIEKLIKDQNPVDAIKKQKKIDPIIGEAIESGIQEIIVKTASVIENVVEANPSGESDAKSTLQQHINECGVLLIGAKDSLSQHDYEDAYERAKKAFTIISFGLNEFESANDDSGYYEKAA